MPRGTSSWISSSLGSSLRHGGFVRRAEPSVYCSRQGRCRRPPIMVRPRCHDADDEYGELSKPQHEQKQDHEVDPVMLKDHTPVPGMAHCGARTASASTTASRAA